MTERSCETCAFGQIVRNTTWPKGELRCMRPARFRNGEYDDPLGVGRDVGAERGNFGELHRWPNDKCHVDGRNWTPKGEQ